METEKIFISTPDEQRTGRSETRAVTIPYVNYRSLPSVDVAGQNIT